MMKKKKTNSRDPNLVVNCLEEVAGFLFMAQAPAYSTAVKYLQPEPGQPEGETK